MRTVIIGASHGGITAALAIKKYQPEHEVFLFEKTDSLGFIPSTINLIYSKYFPFNELEKGESYTPEYLEIKDISLYLNTEIVKINATEKSVYTNSEGYKYDFLILAMGSETFSLNPPYQEKEIAEKMLTYKSRNCLQKVYSKIEQAKTVTIIGGGVICFELASSLAEDSNKLIQIIERNFLPIHRYFDSELLLKMNNHVPQNVRIFRNESFYRIEGNDSNLTGIVLSDGTRLTTDEVILAINPQPNSDLIENILDIYEDGTIVVDSNLRTSNECIYAIGDLIHSSMTNISYDYYYPTISNAKREAVVAAYNITHEASINCPPIQKTIATKLFGKYLASSGLTSEEALYNGYQVKKILKDYKQLAKYGALKEEQLQIQIVCAAENEQILGVQLFSDNRQSVELINQFSSFINDKWCLRDLIRVDNFFSAELSYFPQIFLDLFMEAKK